MIKISVIIPVFNAANFIEKAVESALTQEQVHEIILVEDGSYDSSLSICRDLLEQYPSIRLLQHPNFINRGAGASRNLGLKNAKYEYVAFLDADDFYLPYRFETAEKIFLNNSSIEGVYEAVGAEFYDEDAQEQHVLRLNKAENPKENGVNTMLRVMKGTDLFEELLFANKGWIHLNGLTLKTAFLKKSGWFNENLRIAQDSEFILRCAYYGKLESGDIDKIVAVRGVHANNRILNTDKVAEFNNKSQLIKTLFAFYSNKPLSPKSKKYLLLRKVESYPYYFHTNGFVRKSIKLFYLLYFFMRYPLYFHR